MRIALAVVLLSACTSGEAQLHVPTRVLGAPPLCEASALEELPGAGFLVSDNEIDDSLFLFSERRGALERQRALPLPHEHAPDDIEALARDGLRILIVGSHSRRSRDCSRDRDRQRLLWVRRDGQRLIEDAFAQDPDPPSSAGACLQTFFAGSPDGASELCAAIASAEATNDCASMLDIEGATSFAGRTWLGLRAPLVFGRSAIVRLAPGNALRFDAVVLLDLGGQGVRSLAATDALHAIAGEHVYRIEDDRAVAIADVPEHSEGLWIRGDQAIVVIDGERGGRRCRQAAGQARVVLNPARGQ